jgi:hypothetical protein
MKFKADMVMKGCYDAFQPEFKSELPAKEKMTLDLMDNSEKKQHDTVKMNQKAIMQICLVIQYSSTFEQVELQKAKG